MSYQKYYPPEKDPLEEEETIKEIKPSDSDVKRERLIFLKRQIRETKGLLASKALANDGERFGERSRLNSLARELVKTEMGALNAKIKEEFRVSFLWWIMGQHSEFNKKKYTPWGFESLVRLPGIPEYIHAHVLKRVMFVYKLAMLAMEGPSDINTAYLYYKYIVRRDFPKNEQDFISEIDAFLPPGALLDGRPRLTTDQLDDDGKPLGEIVFNDISAPNVYGRERPDFNKPIGDNVPESAYNPAKDILGVDENVTDYMVITADKDEKADPLEKAARERQEKEKHERRKRVIARTKEELEEELQKENPDQDKIEAKRKYLKLFDIKAPELSNTQIANLDKDIATQNKQIEIERKKRYPDQDRLRKMVQMKQRMENKITQLRELDKAKEEVPEQFKRKKEPEPEVTWGSRVGEGDMDEKPDVQTIQDRENEIIKEKEKARQERLKRKEELYQRRVQLQRTANQAKLKRRQEPEEEQPQATFVNDDTDLLPEQDLAEIEKKHLAQIQEREELSRRRKEEKEVPQWARRLMPEKPEVPIRIRRDRDVAKETAQYGSTKPRTDEEVAKSNSLPEDYDLLAGITPAPSEGETEGESEFSSANNQKTFLNTVADLKDKIFDSWDYQHLNEKQKKDLLLQEVGKLAKQKTPAIKYRQWQKLKEQFKTYGQSVGMEHMQLDNVDALINFEQFLRTHGATELEQNHAMHAAVWETANYQEVKQMEQQMSESKDEMDESENITFMDMINNARIKRGDFGSGGYQPSEEMNIPQTSFTQPQPQQQQQPQQQPFQQQSVMQQPQQNPFQEKMEPVLSEENKAVKAIEMNTRLHDLKTIDAITKFKLALYDYKKQDPEAAELLEKQLINKEAEVQKAELQKMFDNANKGNFKGGATSVPKQIVEVDTDDMDLSDDASLSGLSDEQKTEVKKDARYTEYKDRTSQLEAEIKASEKRLANNKLVGKELAKEKKLHAQKLKEYKAETKNMVANVLGEDAATEFTKLREQRDKELEAAKEKKRKASESEQEKARKAKEKEEAKKKGDEEKKAKEAEKKAKAAAAAEKKKKQEAEDAQKKKEYEKEMARLEEEEAAAKREKEEKERQEAIAAKKANIAKIKGAGTKGEKKKEREKEKQEQKEKEKQELVEDPEIKKLEEQNQKQTEALRKLEEENKKMKEINKRKAVLQRNMIKTQQQLIVQQREKNKALQLDERNRVGKMDEELRKKQAEKDKEALANNKRYNDHQNMLKQMGMLHNQKWQKKAMDKRNKHLADKAERLKKSDEKREQKEIQYAEKVQQRLAAKAIATEDLNKKREENRKAVEQKKKEKQEARRQEQLKYKADYERNVQAAELNKQLAKENKDAAARLRIQARREKEERKKQQLLKRSEILRKRSEIQSQQSQTESRRAELSLAREEAWVDIQREEDRINNMHLDAVDEELFNEVKEEYAKLNDKEEQLKLNKNDENEIVEVQNIQEDQLNKTITDEQDALSALAMLADMPAPKPKLTYEQELEAAQTMMRMQQKELEEKEKEGVRKTGLPAMQSRRKRIEIEHERPAEPEKPAKTQKRITPTFVAPLKQVQPREIKKATKTKSRMEVDKVNTHEARITKHSKMAQTDYQAMSAQALEHAKESYNNYRATGHAHETAEGLANTATRIFLRSYVHEHAESSNKKSSEVAKLLDKLDSSFREIAESHVSIAGKTYKPEKKTKQYTYADDENIESMDIDELEEKYFYALDAYQVSKEEYKEEKRNMTKEKRKAARERYRELKTRAADYWQAIDTYWEGGDDFFDDTEISEEQMAREKKLFDALDDAAFKNAQKAAKKRRKEHELVKRATAHVPGT